jgi:hypothetical protein
MGGRPSHPIFREKPNKRRSQNLPAKLSEKGFEHRSEREFGRYTEHEKSLWVACRTTLQRTLRPFSDSFSSSTLAIRERKG